MILHVSRRHLTVLFLALMLLLAALAATWWHASPRWTLYNLQRAALAGDLATLEAGIDFPALRDSLTGQLEARLEAEVAAARSPLARVGAGLALGFVEPMVEAAVTPETLRFALDLGEAARLPAELAAVASLAAPAPAIEREGLQAFLVRAGPEAAAPAVRFCRERLAWRLCGVELGAA
jgi:hypothetical protein